MKSRWILGVGMFFLCLAPATAGMNPASPGFPAVTVFGETYGNNGFSAICVACHTRNPGVYLPGSDNASRGTHFVYGGPSFPTQKLQFEKTDAWDSGGFSKYGDRDTGASITGAAGEMICESCHNLVRNVGWYKILAVDNSTTDPSALCEGCHPRALLPGHHVLTGEGSVVHGRPMSNADGPHVRNPPTAGSEATYPGPDALNCWSCHRPHRARTAAGARVLKRGMSAVIPQGQVLGIGTTGIERQSDVGTGRLVTDFTPLCDSCHKASDD